MSEFLFENVASPWELALNQMRPGSSFSSVRFLRLMEASDDQGAEDAALELEQRGVMLDISDLPRRASGSETEKRVKLEAELYRQGRLLTDLDENDPLRLTLEQIGSFDGATGTPELLRKCLAGDEAAMQELTSRWLPFVVECAEGYLDRGVVLTDLVQEGSLGLWQAILSYAEGDFALHAKWWICQAMARAVTLQARANGVGQQLALLMDRYRTADRELLTRLGRNAGDEEIALELGISPEEAVSLGKLLRQVQDLERIKKPEEKNPEEEDQAVEDTAYFQSRQRINEMLSGLDEEAAQIVTLRFGLDGKAPLSAAEVAQKLGMTASEVSLRETQALERLRRES